MQDESIPFEETNMPIPNVDAGFDHNKDGARKKRRLKRIVCPFCCQPVLAEIGKPCPNGDVVKDEVGTERKLCISNARGIPLPDEVFTHRLFPIIIDGAPSSGKTHYLTVLQRTLRNNPHLWKCDDGCERWEILPIDYKFNQAASIESPDGGNPFRLNEKRLYEDHWTLESTKKDDEHPPLLISATYRRGLDHLFEEPYPLSAHKILISITDTAGEHSELGGLKEEERNYCSAKIICGRIFVTESNSERGIKDTEKTITKITDIASTRRFKKKVPLAFCVTKLDVRMDFNDIFAGSSVDGICGTDVSIEGKVALMDIQRRADRLRELICPGESSIENARGRQLVSLIDKFSYSMLFPVSALGFEPFVKDSKTGGVVQDSGAKKIKDTYPQPRFILDPLLWILWQHGLFGGVWSRSSDGGCAQRIKSIFSNVIAKNREGGVK